MINYSQNFQDFQKRLSYLSISPVIGKVSQVVGLVIEASLPNAGIGELCEIHTRDKKCIRAEIVGFKGEKVLLMPLDDMSGIYPGATISRSVTPLSTPVGPELLGRVIDGLGNPLDGKGPIRCDEYRPVHNNPPDPLKRQRISKVLSTGIRAIDGLITIGVGQRVGIFAGSGVGKSVMLGMISRYTSASVNVIALIGERGREVREFIERDLGEEGLKRSVVIVATSDQAAMVRIKGALIAMTIAEYFRDQGQDVLFMMDSLTRIAMAQREIGLASGEPPSTKGYTPSVFSLLPKLLERSGSGIRGSISGLYTVLVEGDDLDEPVSDAARAILDGHIVLSRKIASRGHYPAIDVLGSVSRLKSEVMNKRSLENSRRMLELLAYYHENEDLINIGAYAAGSNQEVDLAIKYKNDFNKFLQQGMNESTEYTASVNALNTLIEGMN